MIRRCTHNDIPTIHTIINEAAQVYCGVIPQDCWHEPYMSQDELLSEIAAGVDFWGWEEQGQLAGVMGIQHVRDATLIRHAYTRTDSQGKGIGKQLLNTLSEHAMGRLLVGTWEAAEWAIRFYQRNGFSLVLPAEKEHLLQTYWTISPRQIETSVVLVYTPNLPR